jgi:hypothetical protein
MFWVLFVENMSMIDVWRLIDLIRPYMTGQMSPSGSEEIRMSEGEPDRHYRIDSSVCSESSQG